MASLHATGGGGNLPVDLPKARDLLKAIPNYRGAAEALGQVEQMIKQQAGEL